MDVSTRIYAVSGYFEKVRTTGASFTPQEAEFIIAHLNGIAEAARAQQLALVAISDEFDAFVESQAGSLPMGRPTPFQLIEGGRA